MPNMVFEFFSLPGSGKTTMARVAKDSLCGEFTYLIEPELYLKQFWTFRFKKFLLLGFSFLFVARNFYYYFKLLRFGEKSPKRIINFFVILGAFRYAYYFKKDLVLDQGLLQSLWSLCQGLRDRDKQSAFISIGTAAVMGEFKGMLVDVVLIDVELPVIVKRLVERRGGASCYDALLNDPARLTLRLNADKTVFTQALRSGKNYFNKIHTIKEKGDVVSVLRSLSSCK